MPYNIILYCIYILLFDVKQIKSYHLYLCMGNIVPGSVCLCHVWKDQGSDSQVNRPKCVSMHAGLCVLLVDSGKQIIIQLYRFHVISLWYLYGVLVMNERLIGPFLAATKQLYEWFSPSVRPSVTPFSLCSHHHIIVKFSGVITSDRSDVHAKCQGQRSRSQRSWPNLTVSGL